MVNFKAIPDDFIFEIELTTGEVFNLTKAEFIEYINVNKLSTSSNGILYTKTYEEFSLEKQKNVLKQGVIPEILTNWFNERVEYRSQAKKYDLIDEKYKYYNRLQLITKILLNSLYGVLGLPSFRYYDIDNAEATTLTGQDLIKYSEKIVNNYCNKLIGSKNKDFVLYIDTDSLFVHVDSIIKHLYQNGDFDNFEFMKKSILHFSDDLINFLNSKMKNFAQVILNTDVHYLSFKQELIAKSGIFPSKKRYALSLIYKDGKTIDGELEQKGVDTVRTSFPFIFRKMLKEILIDILDKKDVNYINKKVLDFKDSLNNYKISEIANNSSVNNINNYCDYSHQPFQFKAKGAPVHVKSAINYNDMIRFLKVESKYKFINNGDKVKWCYLSDNPYKLETLSFKDDETDPPEIIEYVSKYISRKLMYDKIFYTKLVKFYNALSWGDVPQQSNESIDTFFE